MDKNAIKKFAVWARREVIARVSQRAAWFGITETDPIDEKLQAVHGHVLTGSEQAQRRALIAHIRKNGYQQVMEEAAYTWFNRFIALRFMEVNGYLPSRTRVFSDENGEFHPQILKDAIHLDMEGLDMAQVYALEEASEPEALFKYLVITLCNNLNRMLPGMFQKISDYTELLFPDFLLREGSVPQQMVTTIPEEDWKDAVQIIGWLYQYYNAEPKDEVFAALKKNIKISKEKIPAATQLFTPDWIVRYMVENSLGRLWVEGHPNDELKAGWKYYLEEAPQQPEVDEQLAKIRAEYARIDPASILCADPCMGSGHILVYMFDVLMQIYLAYGYTTNEAVESIVRNNLWGMDIDDRAAQLAYFAVMMKAQQYDRRWLTKQLRHPVQPNVFALRDSGDWLSFEGQMRQAFAHHPTLPAEPSIQTARALFETFAEAKEYGSIIQPEIPVDELDRLENVLDEMAREADPKNFAAQTEVVTLMETLQPLIRQCRGLAQKYHAVVTNPPYMGAANMGGALYQFVKDNYPDSKADLFAVFIERCGHMTKPNTFQAMITQHAWMFLSSFEKLRGKLMKVDTMNMAHLGARAFEEIGGEVVQTTSFVMRNSSMKAYKGVYCRLIEPTTQQGKEDMFLAGENRFVAQQDNFSKIPGAPVAYWVIESIFEDFENGELIGDFSIVSEGIKTGNNEKFLRLWHEVDSCNFSFAKAASGYKWYPHHKGGEYRKWYGNLDYVINWENDGQAIISSANSGLQGKSMYFKEFASWSKISSKGNPLRYYSKNVLFDSGAPALSNPRIKQCLALFNTKVGRHLLQIISPTLNLQVGDVKAMPLLGNLDVEAIVDWNISLSRTDWDSFETSWDFQRHPLIPAQPCTVEAAFTRWAQACEARFQQLKANEEELNRIFIDIYGLQDELTPDVEDKDVTVRRADLGRDIRSLISYAVGCMLGRYSLDKPGLILAGQPFTEKFAYASVPITGTGVCGGEAEYMTGDCYLRDHDNVIHCTYAPDRDGILPISDDEYFDDDIVGKFVEFIKVVFGPDDLEANLAFIAGALGGNGNPRAIIRQYFLNDFYKDHLKIYQKRPIYWLFDSGKRNGFKCLIYMHRYQPDTIARIRTDYLHETQARYRNAIETLERQSQSASTGERVKMTKRLNALKAQAEEARVYELKIHHLADQMIKIDLDDGVKVNYARFRDVLSPIK